METNSIQIFKIIHGWCVSLPVYFYENPDDVVDKIREFQSKVNSNLSSDPLLESLLSDTKSKKSSKEVEGEYRVANLLNHSLLYFPKKSQALLFIDLIMDENGSQIKEMDIVEAYETSKVKITE